MEILEDLPEIKFFAKCANCGAKEWKGALMSDDNHVVLRCAECPDNPTNWSPLK